MTPAAHLVMLQAHPVPAGRAAAWLLSTHTVAITITIAIGTDKAVDYAETLAGPCALRQLRCLVDRQEELAVCRMGRAGCHAAAILSLFATATLNGPDLAR